MTNINLDKLEGTVDMQEKFKDVVDVVKDDVVLEGSIHEDGSVDITSVMHRMAEMKRELDDIIKIMSSNDSIPASVRVSLAKTANACQNSLMKLNGLEEHTDIINDVPFDVREIKEVKFIDGSIYDFDSELF